MRQQRPCIQHQDLPGYRLRLSKKAAAALSMTMIAMMLRAVAMLGHSLPPRTTLILRLIKYQAANRCIDIRRTVTVAVTTSDQLETGLIRQRTVFNPLNNTIFDHEAQYEVHPCPSLHHRHGGVALTRLIHPT